MDLWSEWTEETDETEARGTAAGRSQDPDNAPSGSGAADPDPDPDRGKPGRAAIDAFMAALADYPVLPQSEVDRLVYEIRAQESRFRERVIEVPGVAVLLLERWRERKAQRRVTGLLAHRFRDETDVDWSAFIDERLGALAELVARRDRLKPSSPAKRRRSLDSHVARTLASADIRLETLQEIAHELTALLAERRSRSLAPRRRELGLDSRESREALAEAEDALQQREEIRQKVAAHNLRLVVHICKRYRSHGVPFGDLIQEGCIGLLRAVDKFDPDLGYRFATYAVWWIEQAAIRAIQRDSRTVRVPSHVYDYQLRYKSAHQTLLARKGVAEREDLMEALGLPEDRVDLVGSTLMRTRSLDTPVDEEEGMTHQDRLTDPSTVDASAGIDLDLARAGIERGMARLSPRERDVLRWRFGLAGEEQRTLQQIGEMMGRSRERVRQIEKRALAKLAEERCITDLHALCGSDLGKAAS